VRRPSSPRVALPLSLDLQLTLSSSCPPPCSAELSEFFSRTLSSEGYSGCEVRVTHARTEIIIRATHTQEVLGEKGRRIRELTSLVQKRFRFPEGSVELYAEKVQNRGLDAVAQCESLRYKLLGGLAVRRCVPSLSSVVLVGPRDSSKALPGSSTRSSNDADPRPSLGPSPSPAARATVSSASSWSRAPRAARSSSRASSVPRAPSR